MGYGSIGAPIADVLARLGFRSHVWTRGPRRIDGVETFAGTDELAPFLARSAILVCALPLTPATAGLLGAPAFAALPRGAFVVNVSRGAVLREDDLLAAVDSGHLAGAALDVFETEPLPAASPLVATSEDSLHAAHRGDATPRSRGATVPREPAARPRRTRAPQRRRSQPRILGPFTPCRKCERAPGASS